MKNALLRSVSTALLLAATAAAAEAQIAVGHLADYSGPSADVGVRLDRGRPTPWPGSTRRAG